MAKGIPVIGRDSSGQAKIVNVDKDGNLKVQVSGTSVEVLRQNRVIVTGKNLFDKSTVLTNMFIGSSGTVMGSAGWHASAPIAVFRGNTIYFNQLDSSAAAGTAFYDGTTFVSFVSNADIIASGYKILVPDGVDNMRCSNKLIDTWQIEYYGTTEYEPYLENNFDVMLQKNIGDIKATIQNIDTKVTPGRNLFDYTQVVTGLSIGSTGSGVGSGSNWYITPYIDIYPGNMLRFNELTSSKAAGTAFYGDDGFISWYSNEEIVNAGYTVQIPPNATKFRASNNLQIKNPENWMIQYGKYPDEFEPYALNTPAHHLSSRINEIGHKITDNRILNYNTLNYWVVTATNAVYAVDQDNALYRYRPTFDEWRATGYTFPSRPSIGWSFDFTNVVLLVGSDIYRSTDGGETFEVVAGDIITPLTNGIHGYGSVACFGEYTTASGAANTVRIWRTADKGATWDVVLTLSDVTHFHTIKYFVDTKEWWATTGDGDDQCRFYKSVDDGLTWELAAGYSSVYRTVGLVKGAKDVLLWAADTSKDSAIFAGRKDNLPLTTRRTAITDGFSLGIAGSNDFLIAHTRPEHEGSLRNNVYVSTDAGNTWCADYSVVAETPLNGAMGILGPDIEGNYYLRYHWLRPGYPTWATIQARPKAMRLPASVIDQGYSEQPVRVTLTSKSYRSGDEVSLPLESFLPYGHIDEPSLVITNTLDTSVTLSVMDNDPIQVAANKSLIERLPYPLLDTFSIDINFEGTPTTGTLKVELIGVQKVPNDIRNMAKVVT